MEQQRFHLHVACFGRRGDRSALKKPECLPPAREMAQILVESVAANGHEKKLVGEKEAEYTKKFDGTPEVFYMQFVPEYKRLLKETKGEFLL